MFCVCERVCWFQFSIAEIQARRSTSKKRLTKFRPLPVGGGHTAQTPSRSVFYNEPEHNRHPFSPPPLPKSRPGEIHTKKN